MDHSTGRQKKLPLIDSAIVQRHARAANRLGAGLSTLKIINYFKNLRHLSDSERMRA